MLVLLYSLLALFLVALAAGWVHNTLHRRHIEPDLQEGMPAKSLPRPNGCCGQHEICEKESLLAAASRQIDYYDDEELDAYCNRPSNAYQPEEAEAFREILYTMREDEVAGWVRSLTLRGINLPDELKDEVFMIVGERRA